MKRLMNEPQEIDAVLHDGAQRARALAEPIMREVEDIVGFLRP
jgi:tryptophanyl-tRNA synthetase